MNPRDRTLYTTLEWEWARTVVAGSAKLSNVLRTFPSASSKMYKPSSDPNPYYVLEGAPSVPESGDETLMAIQFPDSVDLGLFEQPLACDASMSYFHLAKEVLDAGHPEIVPRGILIHLAKIELLEERWPNGNSIEEMIENTPVHERPGLFGYYHLLAFNIEHEQEASEP
jgi:hypothetical protein